MFSNLKSFSKNLETFSVNRDRKGLEKINKIQNFVIDHYSSSYKNTIDKLANHYKSTYPELIQEFIKSEVVIVPNEDNPNIVDIDGVRKFNMEIPEDAIDYLIYILKGTTCLVNRVLEDSKQKTSIKNYYLDFEKRDKDKSIQPWMHSRYFAKFFINENIDEFIFNDYFFKISKTSIEEKKSKLNKLFINLTTQKKNILKLTKEADFEGLGEFGLYTEDKFKTKFENETIVVTGLNRKAFKMRQFPYMMLIIYIGKQLDIFHKKLLNDFSGFNDENKTNNIDAVPKTIVEKTSKKSKTQKTIFEFIYNISNKEEFLNELKKTFTTEKGQRIKAIIDYLVTKDIIIIQDGDYNNFVTVLKEYFNRNIGKYQGIQNIKHIHKSIKEQIEKILQPLVDKYKTTQ